MNLKIKNRMEQNDEIEHSKSGLWLIITTGNDTIHHEVGSVGHANRILAEKTKGTDGSCRFEKYSVRDGEVVTGNYIIRAGQISSFCALLLDDEQRNNFLLKHSK